MRKTYLFLCNGIKWVDGPHFGGQENRNAALVDTFLVFMGRA